MAAGFLFFGFSGVKTSLCFSRLSSWRVSAPNIILYIARFRVWNDSLLIILNLISFSLIFADFKGSLGVVKVGFEEGS